MGTWGYLGGCGRRRRRGRRGGTAGAVLIPSASRTCIATISAPCRAASSRAQASASPTGASRRRRPGSAVLRRRSSRTTSTGHGAWAATCMVSAPSESPPRAGCCVRRSPPRPRRRRCASAAQGGTGDQDGLRPGRWPTSRTVSRARSSSRPGPCGRRRRGIGIVCRAGPVVGVHQTQGPAAPGAWRAACGSWRNRAPSPRPDDAGASTGAVGDDTRITSAVRTRDGHGTFSANGEPGDGSRAASPQRA